MNRLQHFYVVASGDVDDGGLSLARDPNNVRRVAGFASARDAARAESRGRVFVPGHFFGETEPTPMCQWAPKLIVLGAGN